MKRRKKPGFVKNKKFLIGASVAAILLIGSSAYATLTNAGGEKEAASPTAKVEKQAKTPDDVSAPKEVKDVSGEDMVKTVKYYDESSKTPDQVKKEQPQAINVVKKVTGTMPDLNTEKGRDRVRAASTNVDQLAPADQQRLKKLLIEVAKIENKKVNQRIKELVAKAKKGTITSAEKAELSSILPEKNPGQPIKAVPAEKPSQDEQPSNASQGQENEKDANLKDKVKQRIKDGIKKVKPEEPTTTQPDDNQGQTPAQPDTNTTQPGDDEQPGTTPEQPSTEPDDEQQPNTQPQTEKPTPSKETKPQQKPRVESNGYNRTKAVEYAYKWWNKRNNAKYGYYSKANGGCYDCWYDCTNFISQVLKEGGFKEKKGRYDWYDYWFYSDKKPSLTWGVAHSLFKHMKYVRKAEQATRPSDLEVGDIVNADFEKDGRIDHSVVITKIKHGIIYATYHTSDNKDKPINDWFRLYNVYGWKMGTAK
ncbi:amidase domain-containing protein [Marininema halotolerans]|uniref:Putative amidase domain-containing protein n=1 Tax=Marininema halotolerans TaxID=1155944 RepID=A0A1I6T030_9BACL|nr:amidase domain-containing protein [Marininema halotolerans]SFS82635.1 Putative amidase domain-containing protein [Marininema halotolerans]